MPIALDPNQTFPIWLESDASKTPRPEFQFRAVTIRDRQRIYGLPESFKANKAITTEEIVSQSVGLFIELCRGWTNIAGQDGTPIPYGAETLQDVLTHEELWELLYTAANYSHVNHDEKKSSES